MPLGLRWETTFTLTINGPSVRQPVSRPRSRNPATVSRHWRSILIAAGPTSASSKPMAGNAGKSDLHRYDRRRGRTGAAVVLRATLNRDVPNRGWWQTSATAANSAVEASAGDEPSVQFFGILTFPRAAPISLQCLRNTRHGIEFNDNP